MSEQDLTFYRAILRLKVGDHISVSLDGRRYTEVETTALKFARHRKLGIRCAQKGDAIVFTREEFRDKYAEIDALKAGESVRYDIPPERHQRIRLAASSKARLKGIMLTCRRDGDAIVVIRLPDDPRQHIAVDMPARASRWRLDRLETEPSLYFDVPETEHQNVRIAAAGYARRKGWQIKCRREGTGLRVYRVTADTPDVPRAGGAARASRYGLDRLAVEPSLYFDLPPADHHKVRLVASNKGRTTGWKLSCSREGDGIRVTRHE